MIGILIIGGSGSGKTNSLFNLISQQPDIDKIYLYAKDLYQAKYQYFVNKQESANLKVLNDSKASIKYSNDMDHLYKNIKEYSQKRKILIFFNNVIADILSNNNLNPMVTALFIRVRKLSISFVFIWQSCSAVPENI